MRLFRRIRTRKRKLLYHVRDDPLDHRNRADEHGDLLSRLTTDLDLYRSEATLTDRVATQRSLWLCPHRRAAPIVGPEM